MGKNVEKSMMIEMNKIDFNAIEKIRDVDENSTNYAKLKYSIDTDGQHNPIVIRELTEEEKNGNKEVLYGIIDGHHRFRIAEQNGLTTILAIIKTKIDDKRERERTDKILAYRLNETSNKMSVIDKGKVIYKLIKEMGNSQEDKAAVANLGKEMFGLGKAMSYRCLQTYRKSIGEKTIEKSRKEVQFSSESLNKAIAEVSKILSNEIPDDVKERGVCCKKVNNLIEQLKVYKSKLNENGKKTKSIDESN